MANTGIYVDTQSLYKSVMYRYGNVRLDYSALYPWLESQIPELEINNLFVYAYLIKFDASTDRFSYLLKKLGYTSVVKTNRNSGLVTGIACDIFRQIERLDSVIICSSNPAFSEIFSLLSERRIKTYCVSILVPKEIRDTCSNVLEIPRSLVKEMNNEKISVSSVSESGNSAMESASN